VAQSYADAFPKKVNVVRFPETIIFPEIEKNKKLKANEFAVQQRIILINHIVPALTMRFTNFNA
jgi:hypothetical protein